jgi:hypothetical protein
VGLVNALACVLLTYGHFQREKLWKEWDEMVQKNQGNPYKESLDKWE